MIRIYMVSEGTKLFSFRRGAYPSTIYSLSFGPSMQLPDVLVATSSSGSLHIFMLGAAINQRNKKSSSFVGAMIPGRINDVLDPAYHHVLHNVVAEGIKSTVAAAGAAEFTGARRMDDWLATYMNSTPPSYSYAVIRKVEKVGGDATSKVYSLRAWISVITYNGYFREYMFIINQKNECSWSLEREYSVLSSISDITTPS
ncbi:hypothetical protein KSS87_008482 [Heliosperma pusillum]|nr:hypothetical protein KSS87_008482 [Heliosperma pusillum]